MGAFLLRVAPRKLHRTIIYACFAVNILFNAYFFFFTIFQCTPINGFWTRMGGTKGIVCHPNISVDSTYASSAVAAIIDWIFGLLPIWVIEKLQINKSKKMALGAVMGVGAMYVFAYLQTIILLTLISASIAPIVRLPYTVSLAHSDDFLCKH